MHMDIQMDTGETQLLTAPFTSQLDLVLLSAGRAVMDGHLYYQIPLKVSAPLG